MNLATKNDDLHPTQIAETAMVYQGGDIVPHRMTDAVLSATFGAVVEAGMNFRLYPSRQTPRVQRSFVSTERRISRTELGRWLSYLSRLTEEPVKLSPEHATAVRVVWSKLSSLVGNIRPPAATPGGDLGFQLAWNPPGYYLDIDIASDGHFEWFFVDRGTKKELGSDDDRLTEPSEELVRLLVRVSHDR